jgi:DNA-binding transcriptional LysR family regulator
MYDLRQLRVLREVAARGSFSAAAEALDYTQSAVSKQIAALERDAGAPLVERAVRPLRLTPSGAALAAHAEVVLGRLAAARDELEAIAGLRAGQLRLATFASAGPSIVVPAIAAFHELHPQVRLQLLDAGPDEAVAMLRAGELDVAVIHHYPALGPDPGPDLSWAALGEDPFTLVLPSDHPLARRRRRVPITALASEAFIFPRSRHGHGSTYDRLMRGACAVGGFEPRVLFEINDCQTVQAFVAAGLGIAVLPRLALDPVHPGVAVRELADAPSRRVLAARLAGAAPSAIADEAITLLHRAAAAA